MATDSAIQVDSLRKTFKVPVREGGLKAAMTSLVRRKHRDVHAVDGVSFDIAAGEVVGFLGPNGAGKTTTLKMLSGLLYPSGGSVKVLGYLPEKRDKSFLKQITLVMGQRNQLIWDIPALDSFDLQRAIYQIPVEQFKRTRDELIDLLGIGEIVKKPVRNLSLGERMKVEITAALLHLPKVLFLDEPTIGLDVTMQRRIREFVGEYNRRYEATVILTSHYMADVEALCRRVIVIHHGKLLYDGGLAGLVERFSAFKTLIISTDDPAADFSPFGEVIGHDAGKTTLRIPKADTPRVTAQILASAEIHDLTVEDPPIEDVIEQVFATQSAEVPA